MGQIDAKSVRELYFFLKKDDKSTGTEKFKSLPESERNSLVLIKKFADHLNVDEFEQMSLTGDLPAIKLSNEELTLLKGGILPLIVLAIGAIGAWNTN